MHGFGLDSRMWEPQLAGLRGRHRTIAIDLPGFARPPSTPTVSGITAARAALEVLDSLNVDRVHVVGHSLGGAVATDFALAFPHRVRTLVLVDALMRGKNAGIAAWSRCVELAKLGKLSDAMDAWLADPLFAPSIEQADVAARLRAMANDYDGAHWRDEISTTFENVDPPTAKLLGELRAPTLVVMGERDLPGFRAMADEYASVLPNARKVVLPGVGHMPSLEAAEAFNTAVAAFFAA
jgi:3-oxoadipate enol-lactonase